MTCLILVTVAVSFLLLFFPFRRLVYKKFLHLPHNLGCVIYFLIRSDSMGNVIIWCAKQYKRTGNTSLFENVYEIRNGRCIFKDPTIRTLVNKHRAQYRFMFGKTGEFIYMLAIEDTFNSIKEHSENHQITLKKIVSYFNLHLFRQTNRLKAAKNPQ
jgi:hypothetical protein